MRTFFALKLAAALSAPLLAACDDDANPGEGSAGTGGGAPLAPCVERPSELPRPPTHGLPCELLPPDFSR